MDVDMGMDSAPFNHPVWEDYQMTKWPYDHPYGIHSWDPTIRARHWETHPAFHFLRKAEWVPTADDNPMELYRINGNLIQIPKYTKLGDHWVVPKTSALLDEMQDEANFAAYRRWEYQDRNNQRYTYRNKYPPLAYLAAWRQ